LKLVPSLKELKPKEFSPKLEELRKWAESLKRVEKHETLFLSQS